MRKFVHTLCIVAAAVVLHAACHENAQDPRLDMSIVVPDFRELSVSYGSPLAPEWIEKEVSVNAKPEIIKIIKKGGIDAETETVCMGVVPLKDDEFNGLLELVKAADLADYQPSQDCELLVGTTGVGITYRTTLGLINSFRTFCELDPAIADVVAEVDRVADELILDCPPPGLVIEIEDEGNEDSAEEEAEEEEQDLTPQ